MKASLLQLFDRLARRAALQSPLLQIKLNGDSFNVLEIAFLKAAYESAEYYEAHLITAPVFRTDLDLLSEALRQSDQNGLFLEFGVATGRTIRYLAAHRTSPIYGFDSFEGLPEDWRSGFEKGAFAGNLPPVPSNVTLIKGWFNETLPKFLSSHSGMVSLLHIDCDLYSSTKHIFGSLGDRIVKGTVIVFDEYWNYPGWHQHEHKAFEEFKASRSLACRPIGFVPNHQQVGFVVE